MFQSFLLEDFLQEIYIFRKICILWINMNQFC